ncbi:MBL fold metallo-hydrolase [uncultured Paludibaculum sp.]|uniref:MBL fold metallo-hydrolase n=1 Tax=uncultured Paludibaculum sp. TaxID=1765020 RepID=UPI002AAABBC6|nr:MBL fold metallo-hydrolase [uncultured Paludibaculum sp.]
MHRFNNDTYLLRQSKCSDPGHPPGNIGPPFEAPFLYLFFGSNPAILIDSGASASPSVLPLAATIAQILQQHPVPLIVTHTHNHGDHKVGDGQLAGQPNTAIVGTNRQSVASFFNLSNWPNQSGSIDLGSRIIDILPIPGREDAHIAFYDRRDKLLLTVDSLYPGLLVVNNWAAYHASIDRLAAFVADNRPVTHVLGGHIEMTQPAGRWFGLGVLFQPGEHALQLGTEHLMELKHALDQIGHTPRVDRHADFIIYPAGLPLPSLA